MLGVTELLFTSFTLFCIVMNKILNYNPDPFFNVYQRPNGLYWIKVALMYILLSTKQLIKKIKIALKNKKDLLKFHAALENNSHSSTEQDVNTVYFNGSNENGDHLIVEMTRRSNKLFDAYLYLKINNEKIGLLENLKLPDTSLHQSEDCNGFNAEGFTIQCIEPMKMWMIAYKGKMKKSSDTSKTFDVDLKMTYTSNMPIVDLDTDMDPLMLAKCIALEKWNKGFFQLLKEHHQTHYQQYGFIRGHARVENETFNLNMDCIRNHRFGKQRDWRNVHKYNIHVFSTDNGDRFTVGDFCYPITLSSFKMGFVYSAAHRRVYPITQNDYQLYQHGESGNPPSDYAFTIEAGGKTYTIKVDVLEASHFYISKDWESKIIQRLCSFKVNSTIGWGSSECQQRNMLGRNITDSRSETPTTVQTDSEQEKDYTNSQQMEIQRILLNDSTTNQIFPINDEMCRSDQLATRSQQLINVKEFEKEREDDGITQIYPVDDLLIMLDNISEPPVENMRYNTTHQTNKKCGMSASEAPVKTEEFICEHCGRLCGSRIGLWSHLRTHNKPEPQPVKTEEFLCEHCGRSCGSRIGLWSHLRTHNKPEPQPVKTEVFICEHCGRSCGSRIGLWSHLRVHNRTEAPQEYNVVQKSRSITRKNNSRQVNNEQYVCEHCGRVCGSRIGLWSHLRVHNR